MTVRFIRGCATALVCGLSAQAAHADLTAQDVWSEWRSYLSGAGYEVAGTEQVSGDTLTVSDLSIVMNSPEPAARFVIDMPRLVFAGNDDGTVRVTLPETIPMRFESMDSSDKPVEARIDYTRSGESLTVSGTPQDMLYDYMASRADVSLTEMVVDGKPAPAGTAKVSVSMQDLASTTSMQTADLRSYKQTMRVGTVSYDLGFNDPDTGNMAAMTGALSDLNFAGSGTIPLNMDPTNFQAMLADGFSVDGTFTYASGNSDTRATGDGENFAATTSSQGGTAAVSMDSSRIAYDVSQRQSTFSAASPELPFPVSVQSALAAIKLRMPVAKSDAEQDFSLAINLSDFTMSELLWGMFDPTGVLPRDPATVVLDLAGKAKVMFDFLDPNVATMLETTGQAPGELNALTINQLLVSMVGTKLSGTGAFTFDNTAPTPFEGMPKPTGYLDLQLVGANGLLDKLIQMGFVTDQDAMGARMMMGMLGVPGSAEDTLTSKIEINDQGHVLANGQRIQ
jgi:hypothetical protein